MASDEVTQEQFDAALTEVVEAMSGAELLAVPGVYEALSEELNNEAIERARENRDAEEDARKEPGRRKVRGSDKNL